MPTRRLPLWGLVLALLLLPLRVLATSVEAPDFGNLVSLSDYVVRAVVTSVSPEWRETQGRKYIASKVTLEIREIIKGIPPQPLVLEVVGGRIGKDELLLEGAPKFQVGEENILFVHGNGQMIYPLVGIMHGVYPIFRDRKTGTDYVLRSNGMPLYSAEDVSLDMTTLSAVKVQNPKAQPITAAEFSRKIRAVIPSLNRKALE